MALGPDVFQRGVRLRNLCRQLFSLQLELCDFGCQRLLLHCVFGDTRFRLALQRVCGVRLGPAPRILGLFLRRLFLQPGDQLLDEGPHLYKPSTIHGGVRWQLGHQHRKVLVLHLVRRRTQQVQNLLPCRIRVPEDLSLLQEEGSGISCFGSSLKGKHAIHVARVHLHALLGQQQHGPRAGSRVSDFNTLDHDSSLHQSSSLIHPHLNTLVVHVLLLQAIRLRPHEQSLVRLDSPRVL
mmetsp:Transcript_46247/g.122673  ORF Transcript_46247/g.122673 Transcript_46247/m.122673 type:complete len:238 (+) Transcript_46247:555-1268(+)